MKSIRLYLLLSLLATITLVNFVALLHGYQSSMDKAQTLFDSRLYSIARLVASVSPEKVETSHVVKQQTPYTYFQILNQSGLDLIIRSYNAPLVAMGTIEEGFHDINYDGYRWRQYVYQDPNLQRWIVVAERQDIRFTLAEDVVIESVLPIVMVIPVAAIIIWLAVGVGIRPLNQFAEQIRRKKADDLSPVKLDTVPSELETVVANTNGLLARLGEAFDREQRFSADAAHELRTPISVLKVHLHNLKTRLGSKDQDIQLLREGVERMGHLIEQILALYRTSPDQAAVKFEPIDLYQQVQNIIAADYGVFEDKQQIIELEGDASVINGNAFAIETLIKNLLSNANKYTPAGGHIRVGVKNLESTTELQVEDSGTGIPAEQYQRVFERFYRLNGDHHDSGEVGCGLGLTIVKHIVDLHHADIHLSPATQFQSGLKITVTFPKATDHA